ncbi:hypothetical protein OUZ56_019187 [Daphnia magna]|uniref:Uncharacterized protein n=1 Tax=Daphnia magna TaxID=35525 RepID=A0ABQ9ZAW8_9CRUS|nr:hypothetical protein OUZ56_019187 [Daphnia magna]
MLVDHLNVAANAWVIEGLMHIDCPNSISTIHLLQPAQDHKGCLILCRGCPELWTPGSMTLILIFVILVKYVVDSMDQLKIPENRQKSQIFLNVHEKSRFWSNPAFGHKLVILTPNLIRIMKI